jgi:Domain of Unknown Function with PDB structure (DUF3862)
MKKLLKIMGVLFVGGIILGLMFGGEESEPTTTEPKASEAKKEEPKELVTKANFEKIVQGDSLSGEGGMTLEEVEAILGKGDKQMESQSGNLKMEDYTWTNKDFHIITVNFINGKVSFKAYME